MALAGWGGGRVPAGAPADVASRLSGRVSGGPVYARISCGFSSLRA